MPRTKPPFRADHVGSLLRPAARFGTTTSSASSPASRPISASARSSSAERGDDPQMLPHIYARMINAAISDVPADMTKAMHLCRGNIQSSFVASGGYEPVAEILFNEIDIDAYLMEYDSDRAGGFEPLRFMPKGKMVVLGLVTSKS